MMLSHLYINRGMTEIVFDVSIFIYFFPNVSTIYHRKQTWFTCVCVCVCPTITAGGKPAFSSPFRFIVHIRLYFVWYYTALSQKNMTPFSLSFFENGFNLRNWILLLYGIYVMVKITRQLLSHLI